MQEPQNKKRLWRQGDVLIQECDWFLGKFTIERGFRMVAD